MIWLLAHQGGWDEALMVLAPVGLFVVLIRAAIRRAETDQGDHPRSRP